MFSTFLIKSKDRGVNSLIGFLMREKKLLLKNLLQTDASQLAYHGMSWLWKDKVFC